MYKYIFILEHKKVAFVDLSSRSQWTLKWKFELYSPY